jgi:hypothetical protein
MERRHAEGDDEEGREDKAAATESRSRCREERNQMREERPGTGRPPRRLTKRKPTSQFTSMRLPHDIDGELGHAATGEEKAADVEDHPAARRNGPARHLRERRRIGAGWMKTAQG